MIRVIVGICTMPLASLGWDTSMSVIPERKIYAKRELRMWPEQLSYELPFNKDKEDYYWVIEMPKPRGTASTGVKGKTATERFVLYKCINIERGQVIRGRATRIWKAWRFEDLALPPADRPVCL